MGRVIKFRAWDGNRMIMPEDRAYYQHYISFCGNIIQSSSEGMSCFGGQDNWRVKSGLQLMQFTGLLDRNGVEIYEGDIVVIPDEYIWFDGKKPNYVGVVEMVFSQWSCISHCVNKEKAGRSHGINHNLNDDGFNDGEKSCWLIIGNIHQNPELLNHG